MAKTPAAAPVEPVNITWLAQEGDPPGFQWNGLHFRGNQPTLVSDPAMIAECKASRFFKVEGFDKPSPAVKPNTEDPQTAEEYRAYAVNWINTSKSSHELTQRWQIEEPMREKLGVGTDDIAWIDTFYMPRVSMLKKQEQIERS